MLKVLLASIALAASFASQLASAAGLVDVGFSTSGTTNVNFSAGVGATDWRLWNYSSGTTIALKDEKLNGTVVGNLTHSFTIDDSLNSTATTAQKFRWNDGTAFPTSGSFLTGGVGVIGNSAAVSDDTFSFSLTAPDTQAYRVSLYLGSRYVTPQLDITLTGATPLSVNGTANNSYTEAVYTFTFQADNANDVVSVTLSLLSSTIQNSNLNSLRFAAVAVAVVP